MNNLQNQGMHPDDRKNLYLFFALAIVIYLGFDHFVLKPKMDALKEAQQAQAEENQQQFESGRDFLEEIQAAEVMTRDDALAGTRRIEIENEHLLGTISLKGARFDDMKLQNHYVELEKEGEEGDHVAILTPSGTEDTRFVEYGWISKDSTMVVPDKNSVWKVKKGGNNKVEEGKPVTIYWDNGQGVIFEQTINVDENFLLTVDQRIKNNTGKEIIMYPYGLVSQRGIPKGFTGRWVMHEGPLGYVGDELHEVSYKDLKEQKKIEEKGKSGWIGVTEKYWFIGVVPPQEGLKTFRFIYEDSGNPDDPSLYQEDVLGQPVSIGAGETAGYESHMFAGAKRVQLLDRYEKEYDIRHLDLSVDFGMYYFLTKPFYYLLMYLNGLIGNFGLTIIVFTILLRSLVFPLASTSYRSFAKMKQLSPKITALRDKYGDDKVKFQEEIVGLYQKENVNPMAGCLPMLIQIPIFFSLYKVLSLSIEMRHAPFFGWVHDLSAADPTTVFNLFGLIDWVPPQFLMIGIWPCLMFITMMAQRSLSPPPQDKTQAMMMYYMPWMMTYIMSKFAAGLVIYWTFSSAFAVIQQFVIMRSLGVPVRIFGKSFGDKEMEKEVMEGPSIHPGVKLLEEEVEEAITGSNKENESEKTVSAPKPKKKKKKK